MQPNKEVENSFYHIHQEAVREHGCTWNSQFQSPTMAILTKLTRIMPRASHLSNEQLYHLSKQQLAQAYSAH